MNEGLILEMDPLRGIPIGNRVVSGTSRETERECLGKLFFEFYCT